MRGKNGTECGADRSVRRRAHLAVPAALVALGLALGCGSRAPAINVTRTSLELGEIGQQPAATTVRVENVGNDTLNILAVATSCGCTQAWVSDTVVAPGAATTLTVRYDPAAMTPPDTGRIHRGIYIQSDDPLRPEVQIDLYAVVRPRSAP